MNWKIIFKLKNINMLISLYCLCLYVCPETSCFEFVSFVPGVAICLIPLRLSGKTLVALGSNDSSMHDYWNDLQWSAHKSFLHFEGVIPFFKEPLLIWCTTLCLHYKTSYKLCIFILVTDQLHTRLVHGTMYNPIKRQWSWFNDTSVSYALHAVKDWFVLLSTHCKGLILSYALHGVHGVRDWTWALMIILPIENKQKWKLC